MHLIQYLLPLAALFLLVLVVRFTLPARWRLRKGPVKWWWPLVGFKSPYGHLLPNRMRVRSGGETLADSDKDVALVSRHSLLGSGIICPVCRHQAALPGEWDKVVQSIVGEGVFCICNRMLVASPDDDIDPVDIRKPYDESVYHTFARPKDFKKPVQRTIARTPVVNDHVLVADWSGVVDGKSQRIVNGEADVLLIVGDTATVRLIQGMTNTEVLDLPLAALAVLELPTLAPGDKVTINRGPSKGVRGTIDRIKDGTVTFTLSDGQGPVDLPIEHLTKVY